MNEGWIPKNIKTLSVQMRLETYIFMSGNAEFEWKGLSQRVQLEFKIIFEFDMEGVEIEPRLHVQQSGATQIHPPQHEFKNDFQFEREGSARRAAIEFNQPKTSRVRLSQESRCLKAREYHTVTRAPTAKSHKQKHIRNIALTRKSIVASAWWSAQGASLDQVFFSRNRDFCAITKTDDPPCTFRRNVFDANIKIKSFGIMFRYKILTFPEALFLWSNIS